jgi:predicted extracellular nuclease
MKFILFILLHFFAIFSFGQQAKIAFYNVENLFDIENDSLTRDDEFTPEGMKFWNFTRYKHKQNNLAKTIIALGEYKPIDAIGLSEIENRKVLDYLVNKTPLSAQKLKVIHEESPDPRGIDVAFLFNPKTIQPIYHKTLRISFPNDTSRKTRDILMIKAIVLKTDTVHFFVNHWPSRWGGMMNSEPGRILAAETLRKKVDSLLIANASSKIIIMGDFNDNPENRSIADVLKAREKNEINQNGLANLMLNNPNIEGTHSYQGKWGILDMMIVSKGFFESNSKLKIVSETAFSFNADFLLESETATIGKKPFRTYAGYKYLGGFADHLPVYLELKVSEENP